MIRMSFKSPLAIMAASFIGTAGIAFYCCTGAGNPGA